MPTRIAPLLAALAVLALAAALAAPRAAAEEPADAEAASTVTTTLRPGWNMAAWLGEDAPVQALFDAVPELDYAIAWDAEAQRKRPARPRSILRNGLTRLTTGMGLWLRVGGDAPVEWTREAAPGSVLLELREGRNRVGWTGRDGVPAAEALARFGGSLAAASRWNAETGGYERYRPGAAEEADTLRVLRRGDALEVELTSDARWWQSGAARTTFEFLGGVPEQRQAEIRAETAEVLAFYAERYGIVPPEFTIRVNPELETNASPHLISLGGYRRGEYYPLYNMIGSTIAHEYVHILQYYWGDVDANPWWLVEGHAEYATTLFLQNRGDRTDAQEWQWWSSVLHKTPPPLRFLADAERFYDNEGAASYELGALAMEWLVAHASTREAEQSSGAQISPESDGFAEHEAHIRYWQAAPSPGRWRDAFEATFGITVGDFYDAFEAYRAVTSARLAPHRFDREGPTLVFLGDVPDDVRAAVEAELDRVHRFYTERFETIPAEFSIFVGTDAESVAEQFRLMQGDEPPEGFALSRAGACSSSRPLLATWRGSSSAPTPPACSVFSRRGNRSPRFPTATIATGRTGW